VRVISVAGRRLPALRYSSGDSGGRPYWLALVPLGESDERAFVQHFPPVDFPPPGSESCDLWPWQLVHFASSERAERAWAGERGLGGETQELRSARQVVILLEHLTQRALERA
jgi:hypothetical protein